MPSSVRSAILSLLLACWLVPVGASHAQDIPTWERVQYAPSLFQSRFDDIHFSSVDKGWMVQYGGEIWNTSDGGFTWALQYKELNQAFRSVTFIDERVGWVGTLQPDSPLWETRDGGDTWIPISHRIEGVIPAGVCGLFAVSESVIYGVGAFYGAPTVIKSTNGGVTWTGTSVADVAASLVDVHFFDENTGVAIGGTGSNLDGNAVIIRTEDGGQTWEQVYESTRGPSVSGEWGWKISFPTPDVGYVSVETINNPAGLNAKVLKTTDGGRSWTPQEIDGSVSAAGLQGIGFITPDIGWASGRGVTSLTTDGGDTWNQLAHYSTLTNEGQLDGRINRFFTVNDTLAYAVGERVYRISGYGALGVDIETAPSIPDQFTLESGYPNPFSDVVTVPYTLNESQTVRFTIIDVLGRVHHQTPVERQGIGRHTFTWDGRNAAGERVANGSYIIMIDIGNSPEMKQVVFLR